MFSAWETALELQLAPWKDKWTNPLSFPVAGTLSGRDCFMPSRYNCYGRRGCVGSGGEFASEVLKVLEWVLPRYMQQRRENFAIWEIEKLSKVGIVYETVIQLPWKYRGRKEEIREERLLKSKVSCLRPGMKSCTMSSREQKPAARGCIKARTSRKKSARVAAGIFQTALAYV